MLRILSLVSIALMTVSLTAAPARADEAERIARACIEAVHNTADKHQDVSQGITQRTVQNIRSLTRDGAPDRAIIAAGGRGIKAVDEACDRATARVDDLRSRCLQALRDLDADRELILRVNAASRSAKESIDRTSDRARGVIREAVNRALD